MLNLFQHLIKSIDYKTLKQVQGDKKKTFAKLSNSKILNFKFSILNSERGMALVLTLMVLAIITAMVAEFSYGVYTSTNALYNWQTSQRLSLVAKSAVKLASKTIAGNTSSYTYPGLLVMSYKNPFEDSDENVLLRIEDENSKFNVNLLVNQRGEVNDTQYNSFVRLLKALSLDPHIADRIVDWIDTDSEPRLQYSEKGSKNAILDSVDEILLIPGIDRASYDKLLPYVTIYGDGRININGAEIPVLMSLSFYVEQRTGKEINKEMAERIVKYRESSPFENTDGSDIGKVTGFSGDIVQSLMGHIIVKGTTFRVISTATSGGIKRIIESIFEISGSNANVKYWKET